MTYRSDYNPAIDKSVEAGVLLRSTIDEVFSTSAFTFWFMRRFNLYADREELNVEAYLACVEKELDIEIKDKHDVIKALSRSVMAGHRRLYAKTFNGNGTAQLKAELPAEVDDWKNETDKEEFYYIAANTFQEESITVDGVMNTIKKFNAPLHDYIKLKALGYTSGEAARKLGYARNGYLNDLRKRLIHRKGRAIKKNLI